MRYDLGVLDHFDNEAKFSSGEMGSRLFMFAKTEFWIILEHIRKRHL